MSIQSRINVSIFGNWFVWIQKTTLTYAVVISYVSRGWGVFYNEDILGGRAKTKEQQDKDRVWAVLPPWPLALHKNTQEVTTLPGHTGNLAALCKTFETSEKQEVVWKQYEGSAGEVNSWAEFS